MHGRTLIALLFYALLPESYKFIYYLVRPVGFAEHISHLAMHVTWHVIRVPYKFYACTFSVLADADVLGSQQPSTMHKKSALTAALSGQPPTPQAISPVSSKNFDPSAFPCILEEDGATDKDLFHRLGLGDSAPAGSVPTAVGLLPDGSAAVSAVFSAALERVCVHCTAACLTLFGARGWQAPVFAVHHSGMQSSVWHMQADYELNSFRRRGGQERLPAPSASLVRPRSDACSLQSLALPYRASCTY